MPATKCATVSLDSRLHRAQRLAIAKCASAGTAVAGGIPNGRISAYAVLHIDGLGPTWEQFGDVFGTGASVRRSPDGTGVLVLRSPLLPGPDGAFGGTLPMPGEVTLRVQARGFETQRVRLGQAGATDGIEVELRRERESYEVGIADRGIPLRGWRVLVTDMSDELQASVSVEVSPTGGVPSHVFEDARKYYLVLSPPGRSTRGGGDPMRGGLTWAQGRRLIDVQDLLPLDRFTR